MAAEIGLWRVDGGTPRQVPTQGVRLEVDLERWLEEDPSILGERLLVVGRQVATPHGGYVDLLAVDDDGDVHVLELKRDGTPRDVVAQVLDYGSWATSLSADDVREQYERYRPGEALEQAFADCFGTPLPDELNVATSLTVVASDVDAATERIATFLETFGVPLTVALFRWFEDDGHEYLARTWVVEERAERGTARSGGGRKREPWNGRDWYVAFGEDSANRSWDDARRYGFLSAGGGPTWSRPLRSLPLGDRVFAYVPGRGYVGVGEVLGEARPFREAVLDVDGERRRVAELEVHARYDHSDAEGDDTDEYVLPVRWLVTVPREEAVWERGMFANPNIVCKLRNAYTLEVLAQAFDLDDQT